jgi:DNA-binding response OmpR family regulator
MRDNNAANPTPDNNDSGSLNEENREAGETTDDEAETSRQRQIIARQPTEWRILVVDDDPSLAALEAEILAVYGYTVVTVRSGELALTTLRHAIPDLVVLDIELVGNLDGWAVFQELRSFSDIPVLITTSSTLTIRPYIRRCGETRSTLDHLPKPYPMQTLLKRVKRMLPIVP